jgi:ATP-dependent DNA helicase RecG
MPIKTIVKPDSRHDDVYGFVREQLDHGRQTYVVYPLVEESEKIDLKAATVMADHLARDVFPTRRVALLHGRLKPAEKDLAMRSFAAGEVDVLVATTVIEVGVDVSNATVMIVEHAERFGLSQLHQLRGRVGRGLHQSYCILMYQPPLSEEARARLHAMTETSDGFVIAERDLQLRGPGDFFGTRQSGLPTLRIGDLVRDYSLMELAREHAVRIVASATPDAPLIAFVRGTWEKRFGLIGVG